MLFGYYRKHAFLDEILRSGWQLYAAAQMHVKKHVFFLRAFDLCYILPEFRFCNTLSLYFLQKNCVSNDELTTYSETGSGNRGKGKEDVVENVFLINASST